MTINKITKRSGIAGQFSITAEVQYPGEDARTIDFVGSVYGGPVLMRTGVVDTFVFDPERFGSFADDPHAWITAFFAY